MLLFLCHYTKNVEASSLTPTFIIEPFFMCWAALRGCGAARAEANARSRPRARRERAERLFGGAERAGGVPYGTPPAARSHFRDRMQSESYA